MMRRGLKIRLTESHKRIKIVMINIKKRRIVIRIMKMRFIIIITNIKKIKIVIRMMITTIITTTMIGIIAIVEIITN